MKNTAFTIILALATIKCFSQGMDIKTSKPTWFVGFSVCPGMSSLQHSYIYNISGKSDMSFEASIEAGKYFNKFFGIKTGLGYSYFSSSLTMSSLSKQVNTVDTDGDQLIVNETGSRIQEKQNASYIDLPIIFLVKLPFNHFSGFFFNAGINLSLNSSNNYSSSGIYTVTGILPAYNTVLQNQPDYGFYTNQNLTYNGSLKISKLTESFTLSPGYFLNSGNSCFEFGFLFKLWLTKYSIPNAPAYDVNNAKFNSGSLLTNSKFWFQTAGIQLRYSYFY